MWNDDRVATLKTRWADGLSAGQIATELGGLTRNAVIGKVHRLGLPAPEKKAKAPITPRERTPQKRRWFAPAKPAEPRLEPVAPEISIEEVRAVEAPAEDIPVAQRCGLFDLNNDRCRWPIGDPQDPEFHFCGGKTIASLPYCGDHARLAYQPVADRGRETPQRRG